MYSWGPEARAACAAESSPSLGGQSLRDHTGALLCSASRRPGSNPVVHTKKLGLRVLTVVQPWMKRAREDEVGLSPQKKQRSPSTGKDALRPAAGSQMKSTLSCRLTPAGATTHTQSTGAVGLWAVKDPCTLNARWGSPHGHGGGPAEHGHEVPL